MKKNKGFTLVELLAVIVILGIVLTIAVPNIATLINQAKQSSNERQKEFIINATKKYMLTANISLNIGETVNITLQDLIDAKLVDTQIKDLTTNQIMNPDTDIVMVTYEGNNKYSYDYIDDENNFFAFDGTTRINIKPQVPPDENMFNNEQFVFECQIKHKNASGARTIYADTANDQFSYNRIHIQNRKVVVLFNNQGTVELNLTSNRTVPEDEWVKIKVVRNGFNFTIYINDEEDVSGTWNKGTWAYAPVSSNGATNASLGVTYYSWNFMNPYIGLIKNINLLME
ncbi:MAG: prepilin-type N-terminal cleavage/methylation domain-containing protein [Bacilli bacterium]|jgi:type IV pilus assembly protein PilA